jgi:hypothetical protein
MTYNILKQMFGVDYMPFGIDNSFYKEEPLEEPKRRRKYLDVIVSTKPDGTIVPLSFFWKDKEYKIEKVLDTRRGRSLKYSTSGQRFECISGGKKFYLYLDGENKFYVELKDDYQE